MQNQRPNMQAASKFFTGCLLAAAVMSGADAPSLLPYCQNVVTPVSFNPQGSWRLTGISGKMGVNWFIHPRLHHLIGATLAIDGPRVSLLNQKGESLTPFPMGVIRQETYDTQSREFWLDFRTPAKALNLPRFVSAVDVEFGTIIAADRQIALFNYQGYWFTIARSAAGSQ